MHGQVSECHTQDSACSMLFNNEFNAVDVVLRKNVYDFIKQVVTLL